MSRTTWTNEQFCEAVKKSISIAETIRALGLVVGGANYKKVKAHVKLLNLDTSHWKGQGHGKTIKFAHEANRKHLNDILVQDGTYTNTPKLKKRLIAEELLEEKRDICNLGPIWKGKSLVLVLDHINGIYNDHRLENLRLLCPNCDSQQPTFKGRNIQRKSGGTRYTQDS